MPEVREEVKNQVLFDGNGKPRPSITRFLPLYPQAFVNVDHLMSATDDELAKNVVNCGNCPVSIPCQGGAEEGDIMECCGLVGYRLDPPDSPPDQTKSWLYINCHKHRFARGGNHLVPKDQCEACNKVDGVMGDDAINYETELEIGFLETENAIVPARERIATYNAQRKRWGEIDLEIAKEDERLSAEKK